MVNKVEYRLISHQRADNLFSVPLLNGLLS